VSFGEDNEQMSRLLVPVLSALFLQAALGRR
jgi:hypothetical protein